MAYKEANIIKGALVSKGVKEVPTETEPKRDPKMFIRKDVEEKLFDTQDQIADLAKMDSLIFGTLVAMYNVLKTVQANLQTEHNINIFEAIPEEKLQLIEYGINKFENTETLADWYMQKDAVGLIDTVLDRQGKVTEIVKKHIQRSY